MIGINFIINSSFQQFEAILLGIRMLDVSLVEFPNKGRLTNDHHTLGLAVLEALCKCLVVFLPKLTVSVISEYAIVWWVQEDETVLIIVHRKDLFKTVLSDSCTTHGLFVTCVLQNLVVKSFVASVWDVEFALLVVSQHSTKSGLAQIVKPCGDAELV